MNTDYLNPYGVPATHAQPENSGVVPQSVSKELTATRPWVRLISVVMWIGCAMLLLFMALCVYFIATETKTNAEQVDLPVRMIALSFGYGFVAIILIYPALKLSKYASKITRLSESGTFTDLSAALAEQRLFWKFSGILTILYVTLTLLLFMGSFFVHQVPQPATPPPPPARKT